MLKNPYLSAYREFFPPETDGLDHWGRAGHALRALNFDVAAVNERYGAAQDELRRRYAWAVPTEEAILAIAELSPIVELGAGTGYWAWLLRQAGADVIAFDVAPPPAVEGEYKGDVNSFHGPHAQWSDVLPGGTEKAREHSARTLLLCWPPKGTAMAESALEAYRGETVAFIGAQGATATPRFFELLSEGFALQQIIGLPGWLVPVTDSVEIWRRK